MKHLLMAVIVNLFVTKAGTQTTLLPVREWIGRSDAAFVLYISGDGGLNGFSTNLCRQINKWGNTISALDARAYFWDKKTPAQVATDVCGYLEKQFKKRTNARWVLIGYSFGAEVIPFILNKLPDVMKQTLSRVILLSPGMSTDFEVHLAEMLGVRMKGEMDVIDELNKMGDVKTVTLFGSDEKNFPLNKIKLKYYNNEVLPGGHHFDGNITELARILMNYF